MNKFIRPSKRSLRNAQHFAFINAFLTSLWKAGFTEPKITALVTALTEAFSDEDRWYMVARASETVRLREEADRQRDTYYGRLNTLSRLWAGSGDPQKDPAATAIQRVFKLYRLNVSAQMDEETGVMDNLIADLQRPDMASHLEALDASYLFTQMVEANNLLKNLRIEQGIEASSKVKGALDNARTICDRLYDELTYLIEAYALTADDTSPYEIFIRNWNGTLKLYREMLSRKGGKSFSFSPSADSSHTKGEDAQKENAGPEVSGGLSDAGGNDGNGEYSSETDSGNNEGSATNEGGGIG